MRWNNLYLLVGIVVLGLVVLLIVFPTKREGFSDYMEALGCWKDASARALTGPIYGYGHTPQTCMKKAVAFGYPLFTVQDNGWCQLGFESDPYTKYGPATNCGANGGAWANLVFRVHTAKDQQAAADKAAADAAAFCFPNFYFSII